LAKAATGAIATAELRTMAAIIFFSMSSSPHNPHEFSRRIGTNVRTTGDTYKTSVGHRADQPHIESVEARNNGRGDAVSRRNRLIETP
jgi:hypothetical protein